MSMYKCCECEAIVDNDYFMGNVCLIHENELSCPDCVENSQTCVLVGTQGHAISFDDLEYKVVVIDSLTELHKCLSDKHLSKFPLLVTPRAQR